MFPVILVIAVVLVGFAVYTVLRPSPTDDSVAQLDDAELVANADPIRISAQVYNDRFLDADADHYLLDVRTPSEYASGHISNADNIAVEQLASRISDLPTDKPIVVYCRSGNRSAQAANILKQAGFTGVYDLGGTMQWTSAGYSLCTNC